jgi:DNA repair exonuclease SbcCD ATPase subunit
MKIEGIVCPVCNESLSEQELIKSLVCPHCRTKLKDRKYLDFVEFLMAQGIVTDMDFFDQALYGSDAVYEPDIEELDETDPNEFERINKQIQNLEEEVDLNEVTTDEEEFRQWEGIEEDWEEFNRRQELSRND